MHIQQRVVYDIFSMLSDVGGLYDFFYTFLKGVIDVFSEHLLQISLVSTLFRVNTTSTSTREASEARVTPRDMLDT